MRWYVIGAFGFFLSHYYFILVIIYFYLMFDTFFLHLACSDLRHCLSA